MDGIDYFEPKEIAKQFGEYFSTVGTNMEKEIPSNTHNVDHYISKIPYCDRIIFTSMYMEWNIKFYKESCQIRQVLVVMRLIISY